ncbi:unnamed protein product [Cylindrotheca closterium]|uniref:Uncharacterized protein n=1 Tax=Cylindrotheca closterium TaxID=2856 RepID=A0AAD2G661_9STRA|nr:unnamed protein product [Cylindrotheca closterium]
MGTCQSTAIALNAFQQESTDKVRSSKVLAKTRKSQKLKVEIQKYDTAEPSIFSPSGTRETDSTTPSSLLPSPALHARAASSIQIAATDQQNQQQQHSKNMRVMKNPILNSYNEIEVQIDPNNVNYETQPTSAVSSGVVEQFQKLKLQAQLADRSKQRRKRKEKVTSRKAMVDEYKHLWKEYEQIQDKVNNKNRCGEGIPESISFLKDSDAWFIDFHAIHHGQTLNSGTNASSPTVASLSLLSQTSTEAQKKFFQMKSYERKQRKKRKESLEPNTAKDQSASSRSLIHATLGERGHCSKRVQTVEAIRYNGNDDYNVPYRIRSSPSTENTESYLDQTLSYLAPSSEPVESDMPSSLALDNNLPRKRNQDLSIRRLYCTSTSNENHANEVVGKQAANSFNPPISEMSKGFLMMCSPKSSLTDEKSAVQNAERSAKRYMQEGQERVNAHSGNQIWHMSKDHFMVMSSPPPASIETDKSDNYSSERGKVEQASDRSHPRPQKASNQLKPTIDYMSKADFLRMSALPEPVPMSALPDHVPTTVGDPTFDDSQVMSKISCEDTFMSQGGNQEGIEEDDESPQASTSTDEDEEDYYAWDGHMDDEEFWDMDIRRQSLGDIDELASQVSSRISTLLTKFREDNNSIKTRSVNL